MSPSGSRWTASLLAVCCAALSITAGEQRWTLRGPEDGGDVLALAVDPQRPAVVYAGTDGGGVFRTTDGGESWHTASEGLSNLAVHDLAFDPGDTRVVYAAAANGVFRTIDGGDRWRRVLAGVEGEWRVLVHPADGRRLWAGVENELFVTADGGDSWRRLRGLAPGHVFQLQALAIDPGPPATLYAGADLLRGCMFCDVTSGVFSSRDGGEKVDRVFSEIGVNSLAVHPVRGATLYAGAGLWIYQSTDGGDSWTQIADLSARIHALAFDPSDAEILYAGTHSRGLLKSADGGATWEAMNEGLFADGQLRSAVRAVATDSLSPGALWVGVSHRGIANDVPGGAFRSLDGGATWTRRDAGILNVPIESVAVTAGGRVYAAGRFGLYRTGDGGSTWARSLPVAFLRAVAVDPSDPDTVYAARDYPFGGGTDVVFKSIDGGVSWTAREAGLAFVDGRALAVAPSDPRILYLGAERATVDAGGVFRSVDGGDLWSRTGLNLDVGALAVHPTDPATVLAGVSFALFRSSDGGVSWSQVIERMGADAVVFSPSDPRVAYATSWYSGTWRSVDGGITWTRLAGDYRALAVDPSDPDVVYVGGNGLYYDDAGVVRRSLDGGATWFDLDPGLHAATVEALALDPEVPGRLFAGTLGGGVLDGRFPPPRPLPVLDGRFTVRVAWRDGAGRIGGGEPVPVTGEGGYFWFFDPDNVELVAKVLDGRFLNGHHWVYYGAMSDVGYQVTVTDTISNRHQTYVNEAGTFASVGDTAAFAGGSSSAPTASAEPRSEPVPGARAESGCTADLEALCLQDGRFAVEVEWQDPPGRTGAGRAVPLTADTGYFWFFSPGNVELAVKVLDGRQINGRFWVFYGALSDVRYRLTVTDTATGASRTYLNPPGRLASVGDTAAF